MLRLDAGGWDPAPRLPLGDAWAGECVAGGQPLETVQRETCNCGYARGRCAHFPEDARADAVRFSMAGERLIYIFEKNHAPLEHGEVGAAETREPLASLARAFRESYGRATAGVAAASGGAG
jgi:hypothetical protein